MSETFRYGRWYVTEEMLKEPIETLDPLLINQKPYTRPGMTIKEFLDEDQYYASHYDMVLDGTYVPLWKQNR